MSDAAQIEIGKKLTKRNSQLGGSASSLTKERAGKGQCWPYTLDNASLFSRRTLFSSLEI